LTLIPSSIPILQKQKLLAMPLRNSPSQIRDLDDLSQISHIVADKRRDQRSLAKKSRRNRHYEKQFIRNTLMRAPINASEEPIEL
jgi:ribosomal protein L15E